MLAPLCCTGVSVAVVVLEATHTTIAEKLLLLLLLLFLVPLTSVAGLVGRVDGLIGGRHGEREELLPFVRIVLCVSV